jgi:hypothetical protein
VRQTIFRHARANAVGYVALFVALSGTAIAATSLPRASVGTAQLRNGAVTGAKVAPHTLTGANIKVATLGTVPNAARLGGQLPSTFQSRVSGSCAPGQAIAAVGVSGSVSCAATGQGTITSVTAGSGLSGSGSSGAVTLAVPDGGIGTAQLADGSVTNSKLANSSLTITPGTGLTGGGATALGAGTTLGVTDAGIGTSQLADGSVTSSKFAAGAEAPNAAELGGLGPSSFVQGAGNLGYQYLSAAAGGSFDISTPDAKVIYSCPSSLTNNGTVSFENDFGGLVPVFMANGSSIQFNTIGVADMTTSTPASGAHVTVGAHFSNGDLYVDLITAHDTTGDITGTPGCYGYALVTAS